MRSLPLSMFRLPTLGLALLGCAEIPTLSYPDSTDSGPDRANPPVGDASPPPADAGSHGGDDSGIGAGTTDDESPDGGDSSAPIACHGSTVKNCALCAGAPLRCTLGVTDTCVSDCAQCNGAPLPCLHCPPNGRFHGRCVSLNARGILKCADTNRCACTGAPTSCPSVAGASETCITDGSGMHCYTCGEALSAGAACIQSDGSEGKCTTGSGAPSCQ